MSDWHNKALQAAEQGRWEEAISHALRSPPRYDVWQQFPSIAINNGEGMPASAIEQVIHHLSKPFSPHKENLNSFLFEMASNLPKNLHSSTLNKLADAGREDHYVMQALQSHPNYKPDEKTHHLLNAANFWNTYERKVEPHHFATVKSLFTNQPESLTDHRGNTGSSAEHMHLLPHLKEYAAEAQKKLMGDVHSGNDDFTKIRYFKGQPHVRAFRGVSGHYAQAIREAAGLNESTGEVDRKVLKIPVTHLASWTIDPEVAQRFATVEHLGHPSRQGLVIEKWLPIKDLLHSGYHKSVPAQEHAHRNEYELVFGAEKGHVKVPTSGLHLYGDPNKAQMQPVKVRPHGSNGTATVSSKLPDSMNYTMLMADGPSHPDGVKSVIAYHGPTRVADMDVNEHGDAVRFSSHPDHEANVKPKMLAHAAKHMGIVKSEQEWGPQRLDKMAIEDIAPGQKVQGPKAHWSTFDYSHVLPEHHQKAGYRLTVSHRADMDDPRSTLLRATLTHPDHSTMGSMLHWPNELGSIEAKVVPDFGYEDDKPRKTLVPEISVLNGKHRGKGLGHSMYEALFAHGLHKHKATHVSSQGMPHSTLAHKVHAKLAAKHKLNYSAERIKNKNPVGEYDDKWGRYDYGLTQQQKSDDWHKSEDWDSLEKMAVADLPKGKEIYQHPALSNGPGVRTFDYSHLLTPEHREQGYELLVQDNRTGSAKARIYHPKHSVVGVVEGQIHDGPKPTLNVGWSKLHEDHRGKELGVSAYEALFAHAKQHHNVETVSSMGNYHSSMAHAAHRKLSQKHGMDYKAEFLDNRLPKGPNDQKFGPYEYELKNETEWAKSESNLFDGANNAHTIQAMLGFSPIRNSAFAAARFLAAGNVASLEQVRRALWEQDGDVEKAALQAYGLPTDEKTLASLRAVMSVENLRKDEGEPETPRASHIEPGVPTATETAVQVKRAFDTLNVEYVKLPGKHSAGSMIAKDPQSHIVFILKPGSGGQSPAAGASEDPSSQSRREAAYSAIAQQWGIPEVPQADLLLIDGKEYAALHMLGYNYKSMEKDRTENANVVRDALEKVAALPTVFKWATLDYVLGNPDRHGNNIMLDRQGHIRLIDHGSAFAGSSFSPAHDKNSFVPFYLRFRYNGNFNVLPIKRKMEVMPRLNPEQARVFGLWLSQIDKDRLTHTLQSFGIDPKPALARLAQLQLNEGEPADVTVNRAWAGA
jgi:hypothetical protein